MSFLRRFSIFVLIRIIAGIASLAMYYGFSIEEAIGRVGRDAQDPEIFLSQILIPGLIIALIWTLETDKDKK